MCVRQQKEEEKSGVAIFFSEKKTDAGLGLGWAGERERATCVKKVMKE